MKPFLLAFFMALASARPEPPVGYNYPSPSSGYIGGGSIGGSYAIGDGSISSGSFGGPSISGGGFIGGSGAGFDHGTGFGGSSGASYASSGPTVHKHVYVHVAPEEPEEHHVPKIHPVAAPQKHYKIIFIKAPSPPTPTAPVIPLQPQNEEKTLVYVLVKKPEEQADIVIPTPAPTQPSKPEVYFIRYKTQKEGVSGGAGIEGGIGSGINGGIDGGGAGISGPGIDFAGDDINSGHGGPTIEANIGTGSASFVSTGASPKYGPPGYHK